jgi:Phage terminase, small subunit
MVGEGEYRGAVERYARAVDIVYRARAEWVKAGRPVVARNPNGASGVHPLLRAMLDWERASADRAAEVGLTPAAAKRIWPQRGRGRPVGANSAPDRRDPLPAPVWNDRPGMVLLKGGARKRGAAGDAAAVNRARGHEPED